MKKILVTGGAGFIGSHVVEILCNVGYDVTVIDDLSFGYKSFVDYRAKFIRGSIGDKKIIEKALVGVDVVMHLAASSIIKFSYDAPGVYYQNNVMNGIVMLEAMRKNKIKKIIFSSSAAVYGNTTISPIPEDAPRLPLNIYGSSKLAFEEALFAYYHSFGIESVSLRYFNAYGPRDEQRPATRAVPVWIQRILKNKPIPLFWKGEQLRDYVYVGDIARAHFAVMNLDGCRQYNIGSGSGVWMKDIIKKLEKISSKKIKVENKGERRGDPAKLIADTSRIKKEANWKPEVGLEEGLRLTYAYYEKRDSSTL